MKSICFNKGLMVGIFMGVVIMLTAPLFAEVSFGAGITIVGVEEKPDAMIYDLSWKASREQWKTSKAYAILPKANQSGPGILYFHQLGQQRDRKQFLSEALLLAKSGIRSVLIDGNAPWTERWTGTAEDAQIIDGQMADLDIALSVLKNIPGTDIKNLAFVGHDYGAMFGALLYAKDTPIKAFALLTPAPQFADWISYFNRPVSEDKPAYTKLLGQRDPIDALARPNKAALLLQFYEFDNFIPKERADQLIAVAKTATAQFIAGTSHNGISLKGKDQRLAWLLPLLGITSQ